MKTIQDNPRSKMFLTLTLDSMTQKSVSVFLYWLVTFWKLYVKNYSRSDGWSNRFLQELDLCISVWAVWIYCQLQEIFVEIKTHVKWWSTSFVWIWRIWVQDMCLDYFLRQKQRRKFRYFNRILWQSSLM